MYLLLFLDTLPYASKGILTDLVLLQLFQFLFMCNYP